MSNAQAAEQKPAAVSEKSRMDELVALCKRRGFIFPASEIYGGINGFWDYGPLGVLLKNNLRDRWWRDMVLTPPIGPDGDPLQILGVDSSIIQNPKAWMASGHVGGFSDPMVDCRQTKLRYRADHLKVLIPDAHADAGVPMVAYLEGATRQDLEKRIKKISGKLNIKHYTGKDDKEIDQVSTVFTKVDHSQYPKIFGPDASEVGTLTEPKQFNLMFHTFVGATAGEDNKAYLRPETAQGIFLNYKAVVDNMRVRVPFGIAQVGKAFRNEVTPRNFIYRSREFEQMEMEWFCHPDEAKKWFEFWIAARKNWWGTVGVKSANLQVRAHDKDELSHYAKAGQGTVDVEYKFPFTDPGFGELEGIAHRCDFDLTQHQAHSKTKMEYFDDSVQPPRRFIPHVIEPAAGLTRGVLAVLADAYTPDASRPSQMYLRFTPGMAPIKAAVLPLTNKDGQPEIAQKLYYSLRTKFVTEYDSKSNIGKRYARHDEIGTPYCITVDTETAQDQAVTIRFRDTMTQERVALDKVEAFISKALAE